MNPGDGRTTQVGRVGGATASPWWRDAVVYQVYPRSFADFDGDGVGDLVGVTARLPHIAGLGADALWLTPFFPSPMIDGGYDVSDYRDVDPRLGSLADADALFAAAHRDGLRVVIDLVANHTSNVHPWFQAAVQAGRGSSERSRYLFRDGRGEGGELPPNNWISGFGSSAWTRVVEPDGRPGQWYLHTFSPEQPDLDWTNERVRADFDDILRFWFGRGVDGIRVDAAPAMAKVAGLPDADYGGEERFASSEWVDNPHWDVESVHDIFRRWRRIADEFPGDRMFVAEAVVSSVQRMSKYVRPDELHTTFNFQFLKSGWTPALRTVIDDTLEAFGAVDASATWVLGSHDETRLVTRLGRAETAAVHMSDPSGESGDLALGSRRAAALTLLMLALPGSAYIYQGDELGLPTVSEIPDEMREDPIFHRSGGALPGRDGSRVPMPWEGQRAPFGFTAHDVEPWLPQPSDWRGLSVAAQEADPGSMLHLTRSALSIRRNFSFTSDLDWLPSPEAVLDFTRGPNWRCVVNLSTEPVLLDPDWEIALSSAMAVDGFLPVDATAWLTR